MKALIVGAPGSGKGTYASRLQAKLGVDVISMGDIFREIMDQDSPLGAEVKQYVESGKLVPDDVTIKVLEQRLAKASEEKGFILDGFPRTIGQAQALDKITELDGIVLLTVPDCIIIERLSTRRICKKCGEVYNVHYLRPKVEGVCDKCGGPLYQRADDTEQVIKDRIRVYGQQTEPILKHYRRKNVPIVENKCESLDIPPETAVENIVQQLRKLKLG